MRKIVIGDIHGCLAKLKMLLDKVDYDENQDLLILLGDFIDRGPDSKGVLEFVMGLKGELITIGGNHDEWLVEWVNTWDGSMDGYLSRNVGGTDTLRSFIPSFDPSSSYSRDYAKMVMKSKFASHLKILEDTLDYWEDEHFIYVHAGINPFLSDWRSTSRQEFRWMRDPFLTTSHEQEKTVIFGHTPVKGLHRNRHNHNPWHGDRKIGIDGGCVFGGQLNALVIEGESVQSVCIESDELKQRKSLPR